MSAPKTFWLREETKKNEYRRALSPDSCKLLIEAGHNVVVEDWSNSIIPLSEYTEVGCESAKSGSWIQSPKETIVVGLKALPENLAEFCHTHIFFAHAYKEQDGWRELIKKFELGGGRIIDLEFMVDNSGRRVCAFGYWAGYVGAALGALFSQANNQGEVIEKLSKHARFSSKTALINFVKENTSHEVEKAIIIGSRGRSGSGAMDCLKELSWKVTGWDREETSSGGPFNEILEHKLFVNCVLAMSKMPPFITREMIESETKNLNMISDVSCDPDSECNMVPLYTQATYLENPIIELTKSPSWSGLVAIDNLPSILPRESSLDFSQQLVECLARFSEDSGPIKNSLEIFEKTKKSV